MTHFNLSESQLDLLVVVLNYRTANLTIECLRSLVPEMASLPKTHVVVVDNASGDGSVEKIGEAISTQCWDWATLMPLPVNGGFAAGNNAPIREAIAGKTLPPYILLLNPDTVVYPGAIRTLLDFMQAHPTIGIAGSRLEFPDGTPQSSAFRFPSLFSELEDSFRLGFITQILKPWRIAPPPPTEQCQTDWVAGASMIVRREVFQSSGLMDERYFLYFEETDFCLQARRAGWQCWYVPESRVLHYVGQSSGVTDTRRQPKRVPQYWFDSRHRYFVKNHGWLYAALIDAARIVGFAVWRLRRAIQKKPDHDPPKLLSDFVRNSIFLRGIQV